MTEKEKYKREDSPKMVIYSSDEEDLVAVKNKSIRRLKRKRVLEFSGRSHYKIILAMFNVEVHHDFQQLLQKTMQPTLNLTEKYLVLLNRGFQHTLFTVKHE